MNINTNLKEQNTYDAIVIGSGISGGWAAKELTEKGLRVLMLERGMNIEHITDYESAMKDPWEFKHAGKMTEEQKKKRAEKTAEEKEKINAQRRKKRKKRAEKTAVEK